MRLWIPCLIVSIGLICSYAYPEETPPAGKETADTVTNTIGMRLQLILPGKFLMGSESTEDEDEMPLHEVTITKPFYIGVYEVTQEEWTAVMENSPSKFPGPKRPVEQVSWDDVQDFLEKLSKKEKALYRLPTEAEWEFACRAGSKELFYWGDSWDDEYGWCKINGGGETHDVGSKKPNAWGLYDMSGNVFEWCQDWYAIYPEALEATDPQGASGGDARVLRGGSWSFQPEGCRSAYRYVNAPEGRYHFYGFRVVRSP